MFLRNFIVFLMLASSGMNLIMFFIKWYDSDFDTAWKTFEDHVDNCLGKL
jgi:hypothetical protein